MFHKSARIRRYVGKGSPRCLTGIKAESDSVHASTRTESFNRQHSSCCKTGFAET
jgi:hypothetical protein